MPEDPHQEEEYYDEMTTFKREDGNEDYYGEEEDEGASRVLIERTVEAKHVVEKPEEVMLQQVYEKVLQNLVYFLDTIN